MKTPQLSSAKRIVIKVGSLMLADAKSGLVRSNWLATLAQDIAELRAQGKEVVIVSSGAVALGRKTLGLTHSNLQLAEKQAAASCGQIALVNAWGTAMQSHNIHVSQILLTAADAENRTRYLNARQTLNTLLTLGVIPVINENDTVATSEIRYGDNDRLAACVATMVDADVLVLLSDIDGMYTANPSLDPNATLIPMIENITSEIEAMAGDAIGHISTGGMITKVEAAKRATLAGCHMVITKGSNDHPIRAISQGANASWFVASNNPISARKQWIASAARGQGSIVVDTGAQRALYKGNSLLPSGITAIRGRFSHGDIVQILNEAGDVLGVGISLYPHSDMKAIMGKQSSEIEQTIGYHRGDAVIHIDDMVLEKAR